MSLWLMLAVFNHCVCKWQWLWQLNEKINEKRKEYGWPVIRACVSYSKATVVQIYICTICMVLRHLNQRKFILFSVFLALICSFPLKNTLLAILIIISYLSSKHHTNCSLLCSVLMIKVTAMTSLSESGFDSAIR